MSRYVNASVVINWFQVSLELQPIGPRDVHQVPGHPPPPLYFGWFHQVRVNCLDAPASHEEAGEEPVKVCWIRGKNGKERLTKRADELRGEGRWRRGRPKLRREECVKIDLAGVGGEWRMRTRDRVSGDGWRRQ